MSIVDLLHTHPALIVAAALVFGLAIGSFLNVVIYRLPVMLDRDWRCQCAELLGQEDIDGALVGGASLSARSFADIVKHR